MELIYATRSGDCGKADLLLENGVEVDFRDTSNYTSLMWASYKGRLEIVKLLIKYGANVNFKDNSGNTCLMWASMFDKVDVIEFLLKNGADVNLKNNLGKTSLILASEHGEFKTIDCLVKNGADVNIKDNSGNTCLHLSYVYDRITFVKYFLCVDQLDKTIRERFLDNVFTKDKKDFNNYITSINKIKNFRNRVKRYSGMCGLNPKGFHKLIKLIKKREFLEWWYSPEGIGGKRHLENMRRWFYTVHGV